MKHFLFFIFFALLPYIGLHAKKSKIVYYKTEFDLGKIKSKDAKMNIRVFFMNKSKDVQKLRKVVSHCDCTTVDYDLISLQPGEVGCFKISVDFCLYQGEIKKVVYVYTTASEKPQEIVIKASVTPY